MGKVNTRAPYGLVGHTRVNISNDQAIILGGVNQQIFDGYFVDLNRTKLNLKVKKKSLVIILISQLKVIFQSKYNGI